MLASDLVGEMLLWDVEEIRWVGSWVGSQIGRRV